MIKIDKNIPIPGSIVNIFPFEKMKIGDSFFVKLVEENDQIEHDRKRGKIYADAAKLKSWASVDFKITIRKVEGGIRCWRVK